MKVEIHGIPVAHLLLTMAQLDVLMACSAGHYDSRCRSASAEVDPMSQSVNGLQPGFIFVWKRHLAWSSDHVPSGPDYGSVKANFRELDTCLKCLEMPGIDETVKGALLRRELTRLFLAIGKEMNRRAEGWVVKDFEPV